MKNVGLALVDERRDLAHQRRTDADVPRLEQANHLVVHRLVADAVRDEVDAGAEQRLRVVEIEDVRRDAQPVLVRLIDHGRRTTSSGIFVVVPRLSSTRILMRSGFIAATRSTSLRAASAVGRVDHRTGDEEPRAVERGRRLRVAQLETGLAVAAEAHTVVTP